MNTHTHSRKSHDSLGLLQKLVSRPIFLLCVLILSFSCTKSIEESPLQKELKFTVKNDILFFESLNDVHRALEFIDKERKIKSPEMIANYFGHPSLVNNSKLSIREDEEYTLEEIRAMDEMEFVWDERRMILLNEHYELGVGNDVYVFYNKDVEYQILDGHLPTVEAFRSVTKGLESLPKDQYSTHVRSNTPNYILDWTGESNIETREERFEMEWEIEREPCNSRKNTLIATLWRIDGDEEEVWDGDWTLSWGDGSSTLFFNNRFEIVSEHTYPDDDDYIAAISVNFKDSEGMDGMILDDRSIPGLIDCDNKAQKEEEEQIEGTNMMRSKLYFKKDILGSVAGATTRGYKQKSNGKWKKDRDSELDVTVDFSIRDEECNLVNSDEDTDDCNSCWKVKAYSREWWGWSRRIANNEIFSDHSATFDTGTTMTSSLELEPCE